MLPADFHAVRPRGRLGIKAITWYFREVQILLRRPFSKIAGMVHALFPHGLKNAFQTLRSGQLLPS